MKKIFTLLFLMAFGITTMSAQALGDYGSIATGNWNVAATWGVWDGSSFVGPAAAPPDGNQNVFIQPSFTVTVTALVNFKKTLTLNGGNLVCGTSSNNLQITGSTTAAITRARATGTVSGTLTVSPLSTDVTTLNINVSCNSGIEGINGTGKNHVVLASGVTYTMASTRQADDITVPATSTVAGTFLLTLKGSIFGTGTFTAPVALRFGSGAKTISGVTFGNLTVNYTGSYTLSGSPTVTGVLTLTANYITLSTFNLTVTGSISGGAAASFIVTNNTGKLILPASTGGTLFPIGTSASSTLYDPVTITPTNAVTFTVGVSQSLSPAVNVTAKAVSRIWNLSATGAGNTTIAFTPAASTINASNTPGTAVYGHYTSSWTERSATYSAGTWTVSHSGTAGFSPFGVGVATAFEAVLPVDLSKFDVKRSQSAALLTWTTASEKDNAIFNIEQSNNGTDFQSIGQVKGHGTTNITSNYNFIHSTPSVGINYYRLKQVDFDGTTNYSAVRTVVFGKNGLIVKPTLAQDAINVVVSDEAATTLSIFNISGQQVLTTKVQGEQRIDVSNLPTGLYMIRTETKDFGRFVKQ